MDDVVVGQLRGELGLVDEHRDELFVVGQVRQDPLDRDDLLEALLAAHAGLVDLGHAAGGDLLEELVLAEAARARAAPAAALGAGAGASALGGGAGAGRGPSEPARAPASGRARAPASGRAPDAAGLGIAAGRSSRRGLIGRRPERVSVSIRSTAVSTFGFGAGWALEGSPSRPAGSGRRRSAPSAGRVAGAGLPPPASRSRRRRGRLRVGRERMPESVCSSFLLIPGSVPAGAGAAIGRAFSSASTPEMTSEKMSSAERSGWRRPRERLAALGPERRGDLGEECLLGERLLEDARGAFAAASAFLSFPL